MDEGKFSLSSGKWDADIFGNCKFDFIIDKLMDSPPTHKNQPYAKTAMSTIFSNVTHSYTHSPCSASITSAHSLLNTTNPILATGHHSTSQSITPIHTPNTLEAIPPSDTSYKNSENPLPLPQHPPPQHYHYTRPWN